MTSERLNQLIDMQAHIYQMRAVVDDPGNFLFGVPARVRDKLIDAIRAAAAEELLVLEREFADA